MKLALEAAIAINCKNRKEAGTNELSLVPVFFWFILVEQIKKAVIDLVYNTTFNAMVRNSDYLVERFNKSYPYLSTLFLKHENTSLEKITIQCKIEKAKELIKYDEFTLSEIAFMMGYSSAQYLSTQFKAVTGISVTEYKVKISKKKLTEWGSAGTGAIDQKVPEKPTERNTGIWVAGNCTGARGTANEAVI